MLCEDLQKPKKGSIGLDRNNSSPPNCMSHLPIKPEYIARRRTEQEYCMCVESDESEKGQQGAGDEQMNEKDVMK